MKYAILIALALTILTALPALAGSEKYATQRSGQEQSYQDKVANQALQDYYKNNPDQSPNYSGVSKKKTRKAGNLHQKTWGSGQDSGETWGTRK